MKILELFAGTGSFAKVWEEQGHEVFRVELDESFDAELHKNIMELTSKEILDKFGTPDVIWASPPCQAFSVASMGHHWTKPYRTPKTETARFNMELVKHTKKLIEELKPKYWFIENPRAMLRKLEILDNDLRETVTYCQYGDTRMKPTDIWTNCSIWKPKLMCKNGMPCHESAPRGSKTGTQGLKGSKERSIVPRDLCVEIRDCILEEPLKCNNNLKDILLKIEGEKE